MITDEALDIELRSLFEDLGDRAIAVAGMTMPLPPLGDVEPVLATHRRPIAVLAGCLAVAGLVATGMILRHEQPQRAATTVASSPVETSLVDDSSTVPQPSEPVATEVLTTTTLVPAAATLCTIYTVKVGDYGVGIAYRFGVTWEEVLAFNGFEGDPPLFPGDDVRIPCAPPLAPGTTFPPDQFIAVAESVSPSDFGDFEVTNGLVRSDGRITIAVTAGFDPKAGTAVASSRITHEGQVAGRRYTSLSGCLLPLYFVDDLTAAPLDQVPVTCGKDGQTGTLDLYNHQLTLAEP